MNLQPPGVTEATVLVRFDPEQTDPCIITGQLEPPSTIVTFGPRPLVSWDRGENMLVTILRTIVMPIDDGDWLFAGDVL